MEPTKNDPRMHTFHIEAGTEFARNVAAYLYRMYFYGRELSDPFAGFQNAWYEIADAFKAAAISLPPPHELLSDKQWDEVLHAAVGKLVENYIHFTAGMGDPNTTSVTELMEWSRQMFGVSYERVQWVPTTERLPQPNRLVLTTGSTHEGVALATLEDSGNWRVVPCFDVFYYTKTGIEFWCPIPATTEAIDDSIY